MKLKTKSRNPRIYVAIRQTFSYLKENFQKNIKFKLFSTKSSIKTSPTNINFPFVNQKFTYLNNSTFVPEIPRADLNFRMNVLKRNSKFLLVLIILNIVIIYKDQSCLIVVKIGKIFYQTYNKVKSRVSNGIKRIVKKIEKTRKRLLNANGGSPSFPEDDDPQDPIDWIIFLLFSLIILGLIINFLRFQNQIKIFILEKVFNGISKTKYVENERRLQKDIDTLRNFHFKINNAIILAKNRLNNLRKDFSRIDCGPKNKHKIELIFKYIAEIDKNYDQILQLIKESPKI
jgi:hypothetical protein